jgi:hypothetical protein
MNQLEFIIFEPMIIIVDIMDFIKVLKFNTLS